jgi:hypothetical protein
MRAHRKSRSFNNGTRADLAPWERDGEAAIRAGPDDGSIIAVTAMGTNRTARRMCVVTLFGAMVALGAIVAAESRPGGQVPMTGQVPPPNGGGTNAPQQPGTGFILGQVVDATSGKPIPDAVVTMAVRAAAPSAASGGRGGGVGSLKVMTDGEGRFLFHDLVKGNYPLSVVATGYVNANSGQIRPNGPSRPIELGDGERLTGVTLRMWKYAVVSGAVVDEVGEPAVGVPVRVLRRTMVRGQPHYQLGASARTDDRGVYRIATIVPGDFLVAVPQTTVTTPIATMDALLKTISSGAPSNGAIQSILSSGGSMGTGVGVRVGDQIVSSSSSVQPSVQASGRLLAYPTVFYPSVMSAAQATRVSLVSGEDRSGIDFQLRLVPTARVTGTLVGPAGPVPNTTVRLLAAGSEDLAETGMDVATTSTSADGTFTFLGVPAGLYTAKVFKAPRPPIPAELASSPLMQLAFGAPGAGGSSTQTLFAEVPVTVGSGDMSGLSLLLTEGAKASGRLEFEGTAAKPTAQQLKAMSISVTEADSHVAQGKQPGHVVQDGKFTITGLSPGRYTVDAIGGPPGTWNLKSVMVDGRDVTLGAFDVRDTDVTDMVLTFADTRAQLSGTVRMSTPAPAALVSVMLFPEDFRTWVDAGMNARGSRTVTAAKTGSYTIANLVPGNYCIVAIDDADLSKSDQDLGFFEALSRVATHVTIGPGDKHTTDLDIVKVGR